MLLKITGLSAYAGRQTLLENVGLSIPAGTTLAVVGYSGSGKTTLGRGTLAEPRPGVRYTGNVRLNGHELLGATSRQLRNLRAGGVGYVPQHPSAVLDPARRCRVTLTDLARLRHPRHRDRVAVVADALEAAGLDPSYGRRYPHQLSGGEQQRMALATTLVTDPRLLVLDEPTSGLDSAARDTLIKRLTDVAAAGVALLLLTHDLTAVRALANDVIVLDAGRIVEHGTVVDVLTTPQHAVTRQLLTPRPSSAPSPRPCYGAQPGGVTVRDLTVRTTAGVELATDVNVTFPGGSSTAIIGPSGAGKTTLGRALAGLAPAYTGTVELDGKPLPPSLAKRSREQVRAIQYVHQDTRASFDEFRSVLDQVAATARRLRELTTTAAYNEAVAMMSSLGLDEAVARRKPAQLSGGQLQRCALTRALLAHPRLLICDESTSALDTVNKSTLLQVLLRTARDTGTALAVITHDLDSVLPDADHVIAMDRGRRVR